jgi:hypothetical protein
MGGERRANAPGTARARGGRSRGAARQTRRAARVQAVLQGGAAGGAPPWRAARRAPGHGGAPAPAASSWRQRPRSAVGLGAAGPSGTGAGGPRARRDGVRGWRLGGELQRRTPPRMEPRRLGPVGGGNTAPAGPGTRRRPWSQRPGLAPRHGRAAPPRAARTRLAGGQPPPLPPCGGRRRRSGGAAPCCDAVAPACQAAATGGRNHAGRRKAALMSPLAAGCVGACRMMAGQHTPWPRRPRMSAPMGGHRRGRARAGLAAPRAAASQLPPPRACQGRCASPVPPRPTPPPHARGRGRAASVRAAWRVRSRREGPPPGPPPAHAVRRPRAVRCRPRAGRRSAGAAAARASRRGR